MSYNQYLTHMKVCEYLGKEPTGQFRRVPNFLTDLWDGMEFKVSSRDNIIVLQKEEEWFFVQDLINNHLWCRTDRVWSFSKKEMAFEYSESQEFIKSAVEEYLACEVGIPISCRPFRGSVVEEYLACEVGIPKRNTSQHREYMEEHLKCEVGTPM